MYDFRHIISFLYMSLWYISIISPFILLNYVEIRNPYVSSGPVFSPYAFARERRGIPRARGRTGSAPLLRHQTDGSRLGERLPMWLGIDMDPFKAQHVLQPLKKKHIRTIKKNCHHILTTTKWGIAGSCLIKGWCLLIGKDQPKAVLPDCLECGCWWIRGWLLIWT